MESVASNNTQSVIKHCSVFAGKNKEVFRKYKTKIRACISLDGRLLSEVLQGKAQPSYSHTGTKATLNTVPEKTWKQANQYLWSVLLLPTPGSANRVDKKFEVKNAKTKQGRACSLEGSE